MKALALCLAAAAAPCAAQVSYPPASSGSVVQAPVCSVPSIPAGNNVTNTAAETQFISACRYPAGFIVGGLSERIDSRFLFGVSATVPTLRGRVILATSATPAIATCVTANTCVVLLDTGAVAGLAAGSNLYANADVSLTFASPTTVEAAGQLNFRTTATAVIAIDVTSATSTADGPLTIPWNTGTTDTYLVYTATWGAASAANFIQLRQQTIK